MGHRIKTTEGGGAPMRDFNGLDPTDRGILEALSLHEHLSTLQLWYETTGYENGDQWVTREEVLRRLEALANEGLVEPVSQGDGSVRWALKKGKMFDATLVLGLEELASYRSP